MSYTHRFPIFDNDGDSVPGCTVTVYYQRTGTDSAFNLCSANSGVATEILLPSGAGSGQYQIVMTDAEYNAGAVFILAQPSASDKSSLNAKDTPTLLETDATITTINSTVTNIQTLIEGATASTGTVVPGASADGYTLTQMIDKLEIWCNELNQADNPFEFRKTLAVDELNQAQEWTVRALKPGVLSVLDTTTAALPLTAGVFNTSALTYPMFDGLKGLYGVLTSDGYFAKRMGFPFFRRWKEHGMAAGTEQPIYTVMGNVWTFEPTTITTVTLYYQRAPRAMMLYSNAPTGDYLLASGNDYLLVGPAASTTPNVDCELPRMVQDIVLNRAAAVLFDAGNDERRAAKFQHKADRAIEDLNTRYPVTETLAYQLATDFGQNPILRGGSGFNFYNV